MRRMRDLRIFFCGSVHDVCPRIVASCCMKICTKVPRTCEDLLTNCKSKGRLMNGLHSDTGFINCIDLVLVTQQTSKF